MMSFVKKLCADTLSECLMMKKKNNNSLPPYVKQGISPNDDEKKKMANTLDQDDTLDNDQDDDEYSSEWAVNPNPSANHNNMQYETLHISPQDDGYKSQSKTTNNKEQKIHKQDQNNKKKGVKMIGKVDEDNITSKQQDLLDDEPNYFEEESIQKEQELIFNDSQVPNKNKNNYSDSKVEKGRFNDDVLEDFNANGWVDDIEIEL